MRRDSWEHDPSSDLVVSEGMRENLLKSELSEYLTGEVTAGMNSHHLTRNNQLYFYGSQEL